MGRWLAIGAGTLCVAFAGACALGSGDDSPRAQSERAPAAEAPAAPAEPDAAATGVRLRLLGRFDSPTHLAAPPGDRGRVFVVERGGRIRVVRGGRALERPFLDQADLVSTDGEGGMLSVAFAPDFARSRRLYVYYTDREGFIAIDQLRASRGAPNRVQPGSRKRVIRVPHFRGNHKGGQVAFGPDGMLYAGFGDGGGGGDPDLAAQDLGELLGKLIRVEPLPGGGYRVPGDNPFVGRDGARPEIYAYGLRNPYRFSFDRATGDLTVGDVGQDAVEEIDFVANGRGAGAAPPGGYNFGWSLFEGTSRFRYGAAPGHVRPAVEHSQAGGFCSIIGGHVLRDRSLGRGLRGRYVYGDLCNPGLRIAQLARGRSRPLGARVSSLVSFGEDARGRVYAISLEGAVYRLAPR